MLRTIRRIHARLGIEMVPLTLVARMVHSLNRRYVEQFGIEALQPQRVEPLTNAAIRAMLRPVYVSRGIIPASEESDSGNM